MNKKGFSHVEAIISFVLFAGFLIAGLYFLNPTGLGTKKLLDSTLTYAIDEVIKNASSELTSYSVVIKQSVPASAGIVSFPVEKNAGAGIRVENNNGLVMQSSYTNGQVNFDRQGDRFFVIKTGDFAENNANLGSATNLLPNDYSISSSDKKQVISEKLFFELKNRYDSDYAKLKKEFNLPNRIDFSFSLIFPGESIIAEREVPEDVEVFSKNIRQEIIRNDGSGVFADLIVKVW